MLERQEREKLDDNSEDVRSMCEVMWELVR